MTAAKCSTVVGVFHERNEADRAIDDLRKAGFRNDQIGVIARDLDGNTIVTKQETVETDSAGGAIAGAVTGAGVGGLVGLGVLTGVIPVIGPALAAGTLATILTNAAGGAAIGGLGGALIGWGVPKEHATYYDSELQAGRFVVTVQAGDRCDRARSILESHGAYSHESLATPSARM